MKTWTHEVTISKANDVGIYCAYVENNDNHDISVAF